MVVTQQGNFSFLTGFIESSARDEVEDVRLVIQEGVQEIVTGRFFQDLDRNRVGLRQLLGSLDHRL